MPKVKYPKINGVALSKEEKKKFSTLVATVKASIVYDKRINELPLTIKDIGLIAWNASVWMFALHRDLYKKTSV